MSRKQGSFTGFGLIVKPAWVRRIMANYSWLLPMKSEFDSLRAYNGTALQRRHPDRQIPARQVSAFCECWLNLNSSRFRKGSRINLPDPC